MKNIKIKIFFIIIIFLIFSFCFWCYIIKPPLALKSFNKYITAQGINKNNIKCQRNYNGFNILDPGSTKGYHILIIFKDDPLFTYHYWWQSSINTHKEIYPFNIKLNIKPEDFYYSKISGKIPKYKILTLIKFKF